MVESTQPSAETATPPGVTATQGTNGFAIAALLFGIFGGVFLAIAFGIVALILIRKRGGQPGRGMAIAGIVLGAGWAILIGGFIAVALLTEAERDDQGAIAEAGSLSLADVKAGDCANGIREGEQTLSIDAVPCTQPHDAEVFATFEIEDPSFPGDDEVAALAEEGCAERLRPYSPTAADDPSTELFFFHPTRQTWSDGDRQVICIAKKANGKLTGSLQGR